MFKSIFFQMNMSYGRKWKHERSVGMTRKPVLLQTNELNLLYLSLFWLLELANSASEFQARLQFSHRMKTSNKNIRKLIESIAFLLCLKYFPHLYLICSFCLRLSRRKCLKKHFVPWLMRTSWLWLERQWGFCELPCAWELAVPTCTLPYSR